MTDPIPYLSLTAAEFIQKYRDAAQRGRDARPGGTAPDPATVITARLDRWAVLDSIIPRGPRPRP